MNELLSQTEDRLSTLARQHLRQYRQLDSATRPNRLPASTYSTDSVHSFARPERVCCVWTSPTLGPPTLGHLTTLLATFLASPAWLHTRTHLTWTGHHPCRPTQTLNPLSGRSRRQLRGWTRAQPSATTTPQLPTAKTCSTTRPLATRRTGSLSCSVGSRASLAGRRGTGLGPAARASMRPRHGSLRADRRLGRPRWTRPAGLRAYDQARSGRPARTGTATTQLRDSAIRRSRHSLPRRPERGHLRRRGRPSQARPHPRPTASTLQQINCRLPHALLTSLAPFPHPSPLTLPLSPPPAPASHAHPLPSAQTSTLPPPPPPAPSPPPYSLRVRPTSPAPPARPPAPAPSPSATSAPTRSPTSAPRVSPCPSPPRSRTAARWPASTAACACLVLRRRRARSHRARCSRPRTG